jgi:hypothetical protein
VGESHAEVTMRLTPPTIPIFLIAVILAILSVGSMYTHVPAIGPYIAAGHHRYWMMVAAFVIMTIGVVFPGL